MSNAPTAPREEDIRLFQETARAAQAGDFQRATTLAEQALASGLRHPLFFKLRGLAREAAGRSAEASEDFGAVLEDAPGDVMALDMLGRCIGKLGRMDEALQLFDAALEIAPDYAAAWASRGWALENLGDLPSARKAFSRALEIDPAAVRAQSSLALLAARAGDWAEARAAAERALASAPRELGARLAVAMADLGQGEAQRAEAGARGLLEESVLPAQEKGVALTVLGDALDRQDRTTDAFAAYKQANATIRDLYQFRFAEGREARGADVVERLQRGFARVAAADWRVQPPAGPSPAAGHVFLVGFPRSGTTLLGQALATHPQVTTLDEAETLGEAGRAYLVDEDGLSRLAAAPDAELDGFRLSYWRTVEALGASPDGRVFVDKLPMNILGLPVIARLFPQAKVIFMTRDPRDVILSCFRRQFVMNGTNWEFLSLEGAARFYASVMSLAEQYFAALPLAVHRIRYEDLVSDFAGEMASLAGFLGLPADPAMQAFQGVDATGIATPSAAQVSRGLFGEGVGQWRRYERELAPALPVLEPWIRAFGY